MNSKKNIMFTLLGALTAFGLAFYIQYDSQERTLPPEKYRIDTNAPSCIRMYYSIEKHSRTYGIPKKYALGIAKQETSYQGAFDWNYDHRKISSAGALGPMQIMYTTAKEAWPGRKFSKEDLKNDIDFNVETSMKVLNKLYKRYGNWQIVFGYYNTGYPRVNSYAEAVYNHDARKN